MREHAAPCVNATHYETSRGKHMTWNDNQMCTRCERLLDLFAQRRKIAESFEEDEQEPS